MAAELEAAPMKTSHEIVADYITLNGVDMADFLEWFRDCGYPQEEANIHDSRYLDHLVAYVAERDAAPDAGPAL